MRFYSEAQSKIMQRLLKMIGAVFIVALTLAAGAETSAQTRNLPDRALCVNALNPDRSAWARNPDYSDDIAEAKRRGFTVDACRQLIGQSSSTPTRNLPESISNLPDRALCSNALIPGQSAWDQDPRFSKDVTEAMRRGYTADSCRQLLAQPYAPKSGTSSPPVSTDSGSGSGLAIISLIAIAIYFLPAIVASRRHHRNQNAIFVLNLFLGWTLVGWVIALVWSNTADIKEEPVVGRIEIEKDRPPDDVFRPDGMVGDIPYRVLPNGDIDALIQGGVVRFKNLDHLRSMTHASMPGPTPDTITTKVHKAETTTVDEAERFPRQDDPRPWRGA